ncbi:MAG: DUF3147 domain-containing protein [Nitrospirae bacterium]|nr:DUF3147 domain-containing protein [Nitrospirota bacterium]
MSEWMKYALYFTIGGVMVSVSTYLGAMGRGFLAAFASTFPAITGVTIVLIYLNGGSEHAYTYAKHLLWLLPAWVVYVAFLILTLNRLGFWFSMIGALTLYMGVVALIKLALR